MGKKMKIRPMRPNSIVCPICSNPFSQLRKHLTLVHKLDRSGRKKAMAIISIVDRRNETTDNALYEKFLNYLHNRASGSATTGPYEVINKYIFFSVT